MAITLAIAFATYAQGGNAFFNPGNLVVSRSVYDNYANNVTWAKPCRLIVRAPRSDAAPRR